MNDSLKGKIEEIIGKINTVDVLDEQGWTSVVRRIVTVKGSYLL